MKIKAVPIKGKDLKPGDLFSTADQTYWDTINEAALSIGERVYIRTKAPVTSESGPDNTVYKITIEQTPEHEAFAYDDRNGCGND